MVNNHFLIQISGRYPKNEPTTELNLIIGSRKQSNKITRTKIIAFKEKKAYFVELLVLTNEKKYIFTCIDVFESDSSVVALNSALQLQKQQKMFSFIH